MTRIAERTVLFADLRGSTGLFERLGNAEATALVTHTVTAAARVVADTGGQVVKTLGDGLMAVFADAAKAVAAADAMHETLDRLSRKAPAPGVPEGLRALRLQVALARGEVVEMNADVFGDAVNVAARLLDHAGDNETLLTAEVLSGLTQGQRQRFRDLDRMYLRGRVEPVQVYVKGGRRGSEGVATQFGDMAPASEPDGIRLTWGQQGRAFEGAQLPVILGRSPQATFCIDDSRVSRQHARIDWHGGAFQLIDLSYNGTYVRFSNDGNVMSLRRGACTLHGNGSIGLGGSPLDAGAPTLCFEILRFGDTQPQPLGDA